MMFLQRIFIVCFQAEGELDDIPERVENDSLSSRDCKILLHYKYMFWKLALFFNSIG